MPPPVTKCKYAHTVFTHFDMAIALTNAWIDGPKNSQTDR